MAEKMWEGRFDRPTAPEVEGFTSSSALDWRLAEYDIRGSLAHAEMLASSGIITKAELRSIRAGLKKVAAEIRGGRLRPGPKYEDVHSAVEARLRKLIGEAADRLHTARSRNDQVALDMRMFLRDEISADLERIRRLQKAVVRVAWKNRDLVFPGYTHLQHGRPVLLAHHMLAYVEMLERDAGRMSDCLKRADVLPLGSGAVAGTSLAIDRKLVARLLGFRRVSANSIDAVSDRDFVLEFLSAAAITGVHLSRMAEEIVLWASREFSFIEIDLSYCTGSSLMPQKTNPDVAELVRARCGRLMGALTAMLTVMKGLPLSYNRDMQEDKAALFDAADTLAASLAIMAGLWEKIRFRRGVIAASMKRDLSQATDLAEYLVSKGVPFRRAHAVVGRLSAACAREGKGFEDLELAELRSASPLFERDALRLLSHRETVARKRSRGSTAPASVKRAIEKWKEKLG